MTKPGAIAELFHIHRLPKVSTAAATRTMRACKELGLNHDECVRVLRMLDFCQSNGEPYGENVNKVWTPEAYDRVGKRGPKLSVVIPTPPAMTDEEVKRSTLEIHDKDGLIPAIAHYRKVLYNNGTGRDPGLHESLSVIRDTWLNERRVAAQAARK